MTTISEQTATATGERALPDGWRVVRFDQMVESVTDRVDNPAEAGVEYYVGLEHLDPDSLKIRRWGAPTDVEATKLRFKPGDIIFGRRRAYQRKVAVAEFEGICSAHALVLRAHEDVALPEFLPFFMQSETFFQRALSISVGSLSPTINWKTLAAQEFAIPPTDEQRRIAEILWAADATIEVWRESLLTVETTKRSLREHVASNSSHPRRPLATCLLKIVAGKSVIGVNRPAETSEYGVLKVSAVGEYGFVPQENKALINADEFMPEYSVRCGNLLITRANTRELVGRVCIVRRSYPNLMLCDKTLLLDIDVNVANAEYLLEVLKSREVRTQIEASASGTGGAMKNISQADICGIQLPLPEMQTQLQFADLITAANAAEAKARDHLEVTRKLKAALLTATLTASEQIG